jgi:16S rRNA G966 N2-methylase RsmD
MPFAGSGALGFEALSRGAASVVMIERQRAQHQALLVGRQLNWSADGARILLGRSAIACWHKKPETGGLRCWF